jgi:hypothetical protein
MHLMLECFRRMRCGIFGDQRMPRCLADAAWQDAGYSIDAPDALPAGGCRVYVFPDDDDLPAIAEQIVVEREGA